MSQKQRLDSSDIFSKASIIVQVIRAESKTRSYPFTSEFHTQLLFLYKKYGNGVKNKNTMHMS